MGIIKVLLLDAILPALSAVAFLFLNKYAYGLALEPLYANFLIFAVIVVYTGQRFVKSFQGLMPEDKSIVYHKNSKIFILLLTLTFIATLFFYLKLDAFYQWGVMPVVGISFLYVWSPIKWWKPLRKTVFKSLLVALAWSSITATLPGLATGLPVTEVLLITFTRTAFVLGLVLPFDKCQTRFDDEKGLKTLPLLVKPRQLLIFYKSLWLILYLIPEISWHTLMNNKNLFFVLAQNAWLLLPLSLWEKINKRNVWLYDLLPVVAVFNFLIIEVICQSLHA